MRYGRASTDGQIDLSQARLLDQLAAAEGQNPPRSKIRSPLYEAKADPDIYFFGFDLTIAEAKGQSGENPNDDAGWFFVIKERPGEPRFGLELSRSGQLQDLRPAHLGRCPARRRGWTIPDRRQPCLRGAHDGDRSQRSRIVNRTPTIGPSTPPR